MNVSVVGNVAKRGKLRVLLLANSSAVRSSDDFMDRERCSHCTAYCNHGRSLQTTAATLPQFRPWMIHLLPLRQTTCKLSQAPRRRAERTTSLAAAAAAATDEVLSSSPCFFGIIRTTLYPRILSPASPPIISLESD